MQAEGYNNETDSLNDVMLISMLVYLCDNINNLLPIHYCSSYRYSQLRD